MMNRSLAWLLIFALLCVSFMSVLRVSAQEDEHDEDHDVEISESDEAGKATGGVPTEDDVDDDDSDDTAGPQLYITSAPDVKTTVLFPEYPDQHFPAGEEVTVLLGFHNTGASQTYNITYIGGHLHSLIDYGYIIQNFSVREVGAIVPPGEQVSIEYKFRADPSLEPIEFLFSSWIFYNNSVNNIFRNVYINNTVELLEKRSELDAKTLFQYILFAAVVGVIGYTFVQVSASGKKLSRAVGRQTKSKSTGPAVWDTQIYTPATKASKVGSKGSRKATSNKKEKADE